MEEVRLQLRDFYFYELDGWRIARRRLDPLNTSGRVCIATVGRPRGMSPQDMETIFACSVHYRNRQTIDKDIDDIVDN